MNMLAMTLTRGRDTARGLPDWEELAASKISRTNTLKCNENSETYKKELEKEKQKLFR